MKPFDWTRLMTRPYKVYTQLVFWVLVFLLYIALKEYPAGLHGAPLFVLVLQETMELAIPSYTQNLLILPLFRRKKWLPAIALYLVQLALLIRFLPYILNGIGRLLHIDDGADWRNEHIAFSVTAFTVIASFFKIALDRLILDKEQKENELRHLKAQLNPHFLFNTLNNLYGLSVTGSKKLPGLMLQLSELLRYSLYDTGQHYVALQKEIDYISSYVQLERIRLSDKLDIRLQIEGDTAEQYVAPLLMIVFIENAFKHFSAAAGAPAFIHIGLSVKENKLHLNVRNPVDPGYVSAADRAFVPTAAGQRKKGGLGLDNASQRLRLIYPGQHRLTISKNPGHHHSTTSKDGDCFEIDLIIELS